MSVRQTHLRLFNLVYDTKQIVRVDDLRQMFIDGDRLTVKDYDVLARGNGYTGKKITTYKRAKEVLCNI